jgi:predicted P-loop ATPase
LAGLQGTGKQKLFKALAGKCDDTGFSYYGGTRREAKTADAALQGLKLWLWEDQEMSSHVGRKGEEVKSFLSNAFDDVRLPYGRSNERIKRHWVPVGSTNDPEKLLEDASGSRRYNCVRIPYYRSRSEEDPIQPRLRDEWVGSVRDQLMAEARERYKGDERWWLERGVDPEYALRAKVNRDMFTRTTPMDDYAQKVFFFNSGSKKWSFTTARFLREFDPDLSVSQMTQRLEREAAKALRAAGFFQTRRTVNGRKERVWAKELDPGVTAVAQRTGFTEANRVHLRPTSDNFSSGNNEPGRNG